MMIAMKATVYGLREDERPLFAKEAERFPEIELVLTKEYVTEDSAALAEGGGCDPDHRALHDHSGAGPAAPRGRRQIHPHPQHRIRTYRPAGHPELWDPCGKRAGLQFERSPGILPPTDVEPPSKF